MFRLFRSPVTYRRILHVSTRVLPTLAIVCYFSGWWYRNAYFSVFGIPRDSFTAADYTMFVHAFSVVHRLLEILLDWRISRFLILYILVFLLIPLFVRTPEAIMRGFASVARSRRTRRVIWGHARQRMNRLPINRSSINRSDVGSFPGIFLDWRVCFFCHHYATLLLLTSILEYIPRERLKTVSSLRRARTARRGFLRQVAEGIQRFLRTQRNKAKIRGVVSTALSWLVIIYIVYVASQDAGEKDAEKKLIHPTIVEVYLRREGNIGTSNVNTNEYDTFAHEVQERSRRQVLSLLWRNKEETIVVSLEECKDPATTCRFRAFRIGNEQIRGIVYVGWIGD